MKKIVFFLLVLIISTSSCRSKKVEDCPSFDIEEDLKKEETKKKSKWRILILKDGKSIFKRKKKRKKEKLF